MWSVDCAVSETIEGTILGCAYGTCPREDSGRLDLIHTLSFDETSEGRASCLGANNDVGGEVCMAGKYPLGLGSFVRAHASCLKWDRNFQKKRNRFPTPVLCQPDTRTLSVNRTDTGS
jgi:hypothetical protein